MFQRWRSLCSLVLTAEIYSCLRASSYVMYKTKKQKARIEEQYIPWWRCKSLAPKSLAQPLWQQGIRVPARQTLRLTALQVCFLKSSQIKTFWVDKIIVVNSKNSASFFLTVQHIHILPTLKFNTSVLFISTVMTNLQNHSIALEND